LSSPIEQDDNPAKSNEKIKIFLILRVFHACKGSNESSISQVFCNFAIIKKRSQMKYLNIFSFLILVTAYLPLSGQHLTILHTNDTHSQIDPTAMPENLGGVMRRKAVIDSIRTVSESPVILVDAGDAVQGSMFFTLFGGEVEQKLLNAMGYDIQIVGNHEFDNGLDALARNYSNAKAHLLATNYDFSGTPLAGMFEPTVIKQVGDKKVGFIGINIEPAGLIDADNYHGLRFNDPIATANGMAWYLKKAEGVDRVVAITHIGFDDPVNFNDSVLASRSHNIDVIIGGHSHTLIDPASNRGKVPNAVGDTVLIVQTANKGRWIGEIDLDLASGGKAIAKLHKLIPGSATTEDSVLQSIIEPYRQRVDSVSSIEIGVAAVDLPQNSPRTINWLSDFVKQRAEELTGRAVDFAIMNKGGIRNSIAKGVVTKGEVMNMLPFDNSIIVMEISGSDLLENFRIMALQGGNGVSREVEVVYRNDGTVVSAMINGTPVDPTKTYRLATITYLANGGDYMTPLTHGKVIAKSDKVVFNDIIDAMENGFLKGVPLDSSDDFRMKQEK